MKKCLITADDYYWVQNTDVFSVGPFFKEGGRGSRKFRLEADIFWDFFN